jgi:hypothetical protein
MSRPRAILPVKVIEASVTWRGEGALGRGSGSGGSSLGGSEADHPGRAIDPELARSLTPNQSASPTRLIRNGNARNCVICGATIRPISVEIIDHLTGRRLVAHDVPCPLCGPTKRRFFCRAHRDDLTVRESIFIDNILDTYRTFTAKQAKGLSDIETGEPPPEGSA